jgi:hypothetical protein
MRKITILACVAVSLAFAAPAAAFTVWHPVTGVCTEVLLPGADFPGNWEAVSGAPTNPPGPWQAHANSDEHAALGKVRCSQGM